ncbi:CheY-like receiver and winged-helix DNA-binding domain-containing response regulator [Desulfocapsa sulfexigens DSM 10523]|uniref:CheY-like receiver and winged-helix DNA-binding domain-containing response regulator n=1 Tax=Desulfocapsa sulfexigens (strain DSM 10523 / SB164P1) TaxID=1167006 RepID=M1PLK8_DESSD|nr:response regulator transcription factor [Desulfocapsa sulfexigens]AGF77351.1 CheY-like receiver and winged-helix DNA-binding domain-containing response regulator [Desulfocapsa sulfexigens DSM 10523]
MKTILVIDDDKELCELLVEFLQPEGFRVETVNEPHGGLRQALSGEYCLVVLDVMLPGMTGFELLRNLRISSQVPVLMLTARGEDIDRIIGLEMGADDYLPKPFNPRELVARIQAIWRRVQPEEKQQLENTSRIELDDIVLDFGSRSVKQNNNTIKVTAVEFSLLYELLRKAGQVLTREELTQRVLNRKLEIFDRSIDVHVSSLRKKLGHNIDNRERIKTIRSVGYLYTQAHQDL